MTELVPRPNRTGQDPTAALRRALTAFKGILTEEQRAKFVANFQKPDIADVLCFVAEIDATNNSQTKRCVAPRLYTFLESTQRFTAIVDTFVSSNPQIAALVWGGVKVAILTANNISSFFEKVTAMLMEIGKTCPKYQQFGQFYPGCISLQGELCEYYAVIVQICIKIIEISRRAPVSQILSSVFNPFESEFQPLLGQLDQAVKNVRLEISLAANQAIEEMRGLLNHESQNSNNFRLRTLKFQERSQKESAQANEWRINKIKREKFKLRSAIKDNLSTYNFSRPWKQALRQRVPSTAEWLFEEPVFSVWRDYTFVTLLWCPGKMGVGKTIMMSNVVSYLHRSRSPAEVIAYYFASPDDPTSLTAKSVLGTLARQLIESQLELEEHEKLQKLEQTSRDLDLSQPVEIVDFLVAYLDREKQYVVVIDGLDEFTSEDITTVSAALREMQMRRGLKIICAGRPELEKTLLRSWKYLDELNNVFSYDSIPIVGKKVDQDIEQFLSVALRRCLEEESLKLRDPALIIKISETLRERSNGMFLWTHLCIEDLCSQSTDNDILEALKNLPRSLEEIFDRRIYRIRAQKEARNAIKALQYCGVVKRPLTVLEYQEIMSLSPEQKSLQRGSLPNGMTKIWADCCGLLFVDEEEKTVHYVHQSVKQYLFDTNGPSVTDFDLDKTDLQLGHLCMTYLDFSDFKRQLAKTQKNANVPLNPVEIGISSISNSTNPTSTMNRVALKLLSRRRQLQHVSTRELERNVEELTNSLVPTYGIFDMGEGFHFLDYPKTYWIFHTTPLDKNENPDMWKLFSRCMENDDIDAPKPWESVERDSKGTSQSPILADLVVSGHSSLLFHMTRALHNEMTEKTTIEILRRCSLKDRLHYTQLIISRITSWKGNPVRMPNALLYGLVYAAKAAKAGCVETVDMLIHNGVVVGMANEEGTALEMAAERGYSQIVRRLLDYGAYPDTPTRHNGRTALHAAVENGHFGTVGVLIDGGVNLSMPMNSESDKRPLELAVETNSLPMVEKLLKYGAGQDVIAWGAALTAAINYSHLEIVESLLKVDLDLDDTKVKGVAEEALSAAQASDNRKIADMISSRLRRSL